MLFSSAQPCWIIGGHIKLWPLVADSILFESLYECDLPTSTSVPRPRRTPSDQILVVPEHNIIDQNKLVNRDRFWIIPECLQYNKNYQTRAESDQSRIRPEQNQTKIDQTRKKQTKIDQTRIDQTRIDQTRPKQTTRPTDQP